MSSTDDSNLTGLGDTTPNPCSGMSLADIALSLLERVEILEFQLIPGTCHPEDIGPAKEQLLAEGVAIRRAILDAMQTAVGAISRGSSNG